MQHPPVSNGRTTRPSVVSRRFKACIQSALFFVRKRMELFQGKSALFCRFVFRLFGGAKEEVVENKRKTSMRRGEKVNDTCARKKERKKERLSFSLSSRWWWWWWFKRRHYREHVVADDSFPPILLLPFPLFPSPL